MQKKYSSVDECYQTCKDKGYIDGVCVGEEEAGEEAEEIGNCLIRQSDQPAGEAGDCSRPGLCGCFCVDKVEDDEVATLLSTLEDETGIAFSKIEEMEIEWQVPGGTLEAADETGDETTDETEDGDDTDDTLEDVKAEEQTQAITLSGKGFGVLGIPQTQMLSIELFLENEGFEADAYNVLAGTVSGSHGYKKEGMVCVVAGGVSAEDTNKYDVDVACALAEEETLTPVVSTEEAIKTLLANKYGKKKSEVTLEIEEETDDHARGGVEFQPGGSENSGIFLTAKVEGEWVLAFDGNGAVSCEQLEMYDFPEEMMEDCENTQTIETKVDEEFNIVLAANATTGYEWTVEFDKTMIELVDRNYEVGDEELVGSGGDETFEFKALGEGEAEITFSYSRPWESKQPIEKRVYTVVIGE